MKIDDYKAILHSQEDGSWVAEIPAMYGCYALMPSREEALAELTDVFDMIAEEYREKNKPLPVDPQRLFMPSATARRNVVGAVYMNCPSNLRELVVEPVHFRLQFLREAPGERELRVKDGERVVIGVGKPGGLGKFRKIRANSVVELAKFFQEPIKRPRIRCYSCVGFAHGLILIPTQPLFQATPLIGHAPGIRKV